jgi:hypothetical protein
VFLSNFVNLTLHDSFLKFCDKQIEQQTNRKTEHVPADSGGSAEIEHVVPADSGGSSETKPVPDNGGFAADMISPNQVDLEIQKLFSEVLQPDIVALGKKLN